MTIPEPSEADMQRNVNDDYESSLWREDAGPYLRRAAHAEFKVAELAKENERLTVEIKSLLTPAEFNEFHRKAERS